MPARLQARQSLCDSGSAVPLLHMHLQPTARGAHAEVKLAMEAAEVGVGVCRTRGYTARFGGG